MVLNTLVNIPEYRSMLYKWVIVNMLRTSATNDVLAVIAFITDNAKLMYNFEPSFQIHFLLFSINCFMGESI